MCSIYCSYTVLTAVYLQCTLHYTAPIRQFGLGFAIRILIETFPIDLDWKSRLTLQWMVHYSHYLQRQRRGGEVIELDPSVCVCVSVSALTTGPLDLRTQWSVCVDPYWQKDFGAKELYNTGGASMLRRFHCCKSLVLACFMTSLTVSHQVFLLKLLPAY